MARSPVYLPLDELEKECRFETLRRSGPGGQNRNKVETGVRFYHESSGLVGEATEERYQGVNRRRALDRLRLALAMTIRTPITIEIADGAPRIADDDARAMRWFTRLRAGRLEVAAAHVDYAALVAEFFDVYAALDGDLQASAKALGTSSSQIVRLLGKSKALEALNADRARRGLGRLR